MLILSDDRCNALKLLQWYPEAVKDPMRYVTPPASSGSAPGSLLSLSCPGNRQRLSKFEPRLQSPDIIS